MRKYILTIEVETTDEFDGKFQLFNDDVIDGFQLSREGHNLTEEFFLKNARIERVEFAEIGARRQQIQEIRRIIEDWGPTSSSELELESSPCLNSMGNGKNNVSELIEYFNHDGVGTVVYQDQTELDENDYSYNELSDDILEEVYEIMVQYDVDMTKTMDRCRD